MSMFIRTAEPLLFLKCQNSNPPESCCLCQNVCQVKLEQIQMDIVWSCGVMFWLLRTISKCFYLSSRRCNVRNVTSRTMFCCYYLENGAVYQRFIFTKVLLLDIQLCDKNVFKIFHVVILGKTYVLTPVRDFF